MAGNSARALQAGVSVALAKKLACTFIPCRRGRSRRFLLGRRVCDCSRSYRSIQAALVSIRTFLEMCAFSRLISSTPWFSTAFTFSGSMTVGKSNQRPTCL